MSTNDEDEPKNKEEVQSNSTESASTADAIEHEIDHNVVTQNEADSKPNELENEVPKIPQVKETESEARKEATQDAVESKDNNDKDDAFKKPAAAPTTTAAATSEYAAEHVTYKEDGTAIYTDPNTKHKYRWCEQSNNWLPLESTSTSTMTQNANPYENEHYKWCSETQRWVLKASQATETEFYKWDAEKNEWIPKSIINNESKVGEQTNLVEKVYGIDEHGQRTYTDKDGTVFFWDEEKSAWFPKIDDDFMARYQMSYGFIDNVSAGEEEKRKKADTEAQRKATELAHMAEEARAAMENATAAGNSSNAAGGVGGKRKFQEPPKWFDIDPEHNTKVYVTNLPLDITIDEFAELMGKCGMIMRDQQTQKYKLKLYTEADGQIKGDGLCDYIKVESVNLALKILDEYVYRGNKIRVQPAKFQMRGEYNPALKPKRRKKDKEKLKKLKEKLFDWRPDKMRGERSKNEKSVIIKNLFTPDIFEKNIQLILDYQNDLREECNKCGTVRKVIIYDLHPEGVAQINMASPEEADLVIQMMHGRFFGKRQLSAEHWDGKTKYKIGESEKEAQERLSNWDEFLETDETEKAKKNELEAELTVKEDTINEAVEAATESQTEEIV